MLLRFCLLLLLAAPLAFAQSDVPVRGNDQARVSPNASVSQTIGTTVVTIQYGRPSVNGRTVYGDLVPYGQVWRAGANEATVFTATGDVKIEGQALPAGTYALFALPTESGWTLIFNKTAAQWGSYRYDQAQDALRVPVTPVTAPAQEQLLYTFEEVSATSAEAVLHWSTLRVPFTVSVE